jgi:hypothetical protein
MSEYTLHIYCIYYVDVMNIKCIYYVYTMNINCILIFILCSGQPQQRAHCVWQGICLETPGNDARHIQGCYCGPDNRVACRAANTTNWCDALVFLWTFYPWTEMRCPPQLCVPRRSARAAGVPGINCTTLTRCSHSETPNRFALSWKPSASSCSIKMGRLVKGAGNG